MLHSKEYDFLAVFKSSMLITMILISTACTDTSVEKNTDTALDANEAVNNEVVINDAVNDEMDEAAVSAESAMPAVPTDNHYIPGVATPTPTPVESIDVNVSIVLQESGVSAGDIVTAKIMQDSQLVTEGGGINLHYDSQFIEIQEVNVDTVVWTFKHQNGVIDNDNGVVSDIIFANYTDVQGENVIATITIKVLSDNKTEISMTESSLNPFASRGNRVATGFETLFIN